MVEPRRTGVRLISAILLASLVVAAAVAVVLRRRGAELELSSLESATRRQVTGPITVVLTGDTMILAPIQSSDGLSGVAPIVRDSSVAITNLETTFFDRSNAPDRPEGQSGAWPFGTAGAAEQLRRIGFSMVSCANNHSVDYGADGLRATVGVLDKAGVRHAGCGDDLDAARAPTHLGDGPRRVSLIAVTTSSAPEARATRRQGDILGRAGVNPLRYAADVMADPHTFEILRRSPTAQQATTTHVTIAGTTIRKGDRTAVEFVADERDVREIADAITAARAYSDVVIVSLHSHEPANGAPAPVTFVQRFAREAIEAGAQIVFGHGPHQLRGIERYKGGVILYSLGDFAYQRAATAAATPDVFDAGIDLYELALGTMPEDPALKRPPLVGDVWLEGAIAVATLDGAMLRSVRIVPLDLGIDRPIEGRGLPRVADPPRAKRILERLARLSEAFGTVLVREADTGIVFARP
jgi:poly-gamma-glutamate capsule biosynthesis protein CapA/YwtB (metallophosphatase superfamily)